MSSLSNVNFVKRTAGLLSMLAASAVVALPIAAQSKPEAPSAGTTTPVSPVAPTRQVAPSGTMTPANPTAPANTVTPTPSDAQEITPNTGAPTQTLERPVNPTSQTPSSKPSAAQTPNSTVPRVAATSGNIVDVASSSNTFRTLVSALTEAQLSEVLKGQGPFTVFAPTDAAFAALPPGTLEELMKPENRAVLVQLLKYHVVPGDYPSNSLASGEVPTAAGVPVTITVREGKVKVNDANVVGPDITASNGVIHAIDRVILPPTTSAAPTTTPTTPRTAPATQAAPTTPRTTPTTPGTATPTTPVAPRTAPTTPTTPTP